jgi:hypothetical protein
MNASTLIRTAPELKTPPQVRQTPCETCPAVSADQRKKQEVDWLFEARVQWFLAVSRAA